MKLRRRVRSLVEAVLILIAFGTIPFLPRRVIVCMARCFGRLGFLCSRSLRRITFANLDLAFGDTRTPDEKRRIAIGSFQTSALVFLDLLWFGMFSERRVRKYVHLDESVQPCFDLAPLVAVTGHLGNWEVFGQTLSLHGAPLLSVVAPVKSFAVDWIVNRTRGRTGQTVVRKKGAGRILLRELLKGGRTAILVDQNTLPLRGGEFVEFFGLPVPVTKAVAVLSHRTGSSVIVGCCIPDARGHYTAHCLAPFDPKAEELQEGQITRRVTGMIQEAISRYPENWLWSYKRWKYIPEGADAARYPFYAEQKRVQWRQSTAGEVEEA